MPGGRRVFLAAFRGHPPLVSLVGAAGDAQRHPVLRAARAGETWLDRSQIELDYVTVLRLGLAALVPKSLGFGVSGDERDVLRWPPGQFQVANRFLIDRKHGAGTAKFRRHIAD